jgi:outer membrane protein assembly factor BamD (BamD/ComL family)
MEKLGQFLIGLLAFLLGGALTAWFIWRTLKKSDDPGRMLFKWIATAVVLVILLVFGASLGRLGYAGAFIVPIGAAAFGVVLGIIWAPHIGALLARPFTSFYDGGDTEVELRPFYSIARAKQKRGNYQDAIAEVAKQLERFPEDYEGWMLMAELYGDNLKDNEQAQNCLAEILSHKDHKPKNIVFTLNRSADWHLGLASDREAAREALEEIVRRFPDSEFAHSASQRIAHLTTGQMLAEQRVRPTIHLVQRDEHIGLQGKIADPRAAPEEPAAAAARLVQHLQDFPDDVESREQLASLYADHYARMDLAADQIEHLITTPGASPKEVAHWLNMLADFHIRVGQDRAAAQAALQRISSLFPKSAVAGLAESRLAYLDGEFRRNTKSQVLKLGSYENNLGLKGQVPKRP